MFQRSGFLSSDFRPLASDTQWRWLSQQYTEKAKQDKK